MEVKIYPGISDNHTDKRRRIEEAVLEKALLLPFPVRQVKIITFFQEAIDSKMPVGNHYHPKSSERDELFVFVGELSQAERKNSPVAVIFRFREPGESETQEAKLKVGDACFVPAGYSHAFLPLRRGLRMIGFSNKPFLKEDDVIDKLF